jgi:hypothetical protein
MPLKKLTQAEINQRFEAVKDLMEVGYTRQIACKKLGICRTSLNIHLNDHQKRELDEVQFSFSDGMGAMSVMHHNRKKPSKTK